MPVYFIASYDVEDPEAYEKYVMAADSILEKHGGEILVADESAKAIEGHGGEVNVIIKFESEAMGMGFYNDPDYQSIMQIRHESTKNGTLVLSTAFNPVEMAG